MNLDFEKMDGLVPAIVQDITTNKVLMVGFMNQEAYDLTIKNKKATFYSRTRECVWEKGETSGNVIHVHEVLIDCDRDTVLIKGQPEGPVCHTGDDTCFKETNEQGINFISTLENIILDRSKNQSESSYTSSLLSRGINKVAQKVGEEAVELVIEAKDDNKDLFLGEAADLIYHLLVLFRAKEISMDEVISVLKKRHKESV